MKIKIITSPSELPSFQLDKPVFCDIETHGLYINVRLIQFYQPEYDEDTVFILDLAPTGYNRLLYDSELTKAKDYMKPLWLVFYNASYDLGTLGIVPAKLDDLFYSVRTAHWSYMEYKLDKVVVKMGFGNLYAGLDKNMLQKQGFVLGAYLSQAQIKYSAIDVIVLSLMWKDPAIQTVMKTNTAYQVDMMSLVYAIQYQQNGMLVNTTMRDEFYNSSSARVVKLTKELPYWDKESKSVNDNFIGEPLNVNSYIQVRAYLSIDKSDADTLVKFSLSSNPLANKAKVILELKASRKQVSYLNGIQYNKIFTHFNPAGAQTGRFTSTGGDRQDAINSQQIPRTFQKIFKSPTAPGEDSRYPDGSVVIGLDYSTLELRLACTLFNEPEMYRQLMDGEDLHTSMAGMITGKPLHKDGLIKMMVAGQSDKVIRHSDYITDIDRLRAKGCNFGFVFGMSAGTFQNYAFTSYGVELTLKEAEDMRTMYFKKYPKFKAFHAHIWDNYKKPNFYVETALGRKVKPKLGTDGINVPVQGSGAETTKLAVHYLIKEYPIVLNYIENVVHDAIYIRVPTDEEVVWTQRLRDAMVKGWTEISKTKMFSFKDIPMPVEV